nr:MAG TPA_asm: hypothetical protein [Caudoviricetes sp.]
MPANTKKILVNADSACLVNAGLGHYSFTTYGDTVLVNDF